MSQKISRSERCKRRSKSFQECTVCVIVSNDGYSAESHKQVIPHHRLGQGMGRNIHRSLRNTWQTLWVLFPGSSSEAKCRAPQTFICVYSVLQIMNTKICYRDILMLLGSAMIHSCPKYQRLIQKRTRFPEINVYQHVSFKNHRYRLMYNQ